MQAISNRLEIETNTWYDNHYRNSNSILFIVIEFTFILWNVLIFSFFVNASNVVVQLPCIVGHNTGFSGGVLYKNGQL